MAKEPYPSETADRYIVRFPEGMRDRLKDLAAANGRSMNAEIIRRLQDTIDKDDMSDDGPLFLRLPDDLAEKIDAAAKRMNRTAGAQALDTLEKAYLPPKS